MVKSIEAAQAELDQIEGRWSDDDRFRRRLEQVELNRRLRIVRAAARLAHDDAERDREQTERDDVVLQARRAATRGMQSVRAAWPDAPVAADRAVISREWRLDSDGVLYRHASASGWWRVCSPLVAVEDTRGGGSRFAVRKTKSWRTVDVDAATAESDRDLAAVLEQAGLWVNPEPLVVDADTNSEEHVPAARVVSYWLTGRWGDVIVAAGPAARRLDHHPVEDDERVVAARQAAAAGIYTKGI